MLEGLRPTTAETFTSLRSAANEISKFDSSGTFMMKWGTAGSGPGEFDRPLDLAIDANNLVYVCDDVNDRVQVFDRNGSYLSEWSVPFPLIIDVHPNGNIYVWNDDDRRVEVYNPSGVFQFQFAQAEVIDCQGLEIDLRGVVYISTGEFSGNEIRKYTENGTLLDIFGGSGSGAGEFDGSAGLHTDDRGNLYVADFFSDRVQLFDSTGTFLGMFGKDGEDPGQMQRPIDILWRPGGKLYVVERRSARVQAFQTFDCPPVVEVTSAHEAIYYDVGQSVSITWETGDDRGVSTVDLSYVTDQKLYGVATLGATGNPSTFYEIDPETGAVTTIGAVGFDYVNALDTDPETGVLYAIGENPSDSEWVLLTIDPLTGLGTEIGPACLSAPITDTSFEPGTNRFLAVGQPTLTAPAIYEINRWTGEARPLGDTMIEGLPNGMDFASSGVLYATPINLSGGTQRVNIATTTGVAFGPKDIVFPAAIQNNPDIRDIDRNPLENTPLCTFRDFTTGMRLGRFFVEASPPRVELIGATALGMIGIAWHPGTETVIATGEPNDGQFTWTVPNVPTNAGRIKVTANADGGQSSFDYSNGFFAILNTVEAQAPTSRGLLLAAPSPNPTSGAARIQFVLPSAGTVDLAVHDLRGRLVRELASGEMSAGEHSLQWDGRDQSGVAVPSGAYFIRLRAAGEQRTQTLNLIR